MYRIGIIAVAIGAAIRTSATAPADTLELADGTKIENCYARDEGTRYVVWERLADVGGPPKVFPRSKVTKHTIQRDDAWDAKPKLPDLTVTFIEMNPKLAGLHGAVHYDKFGRPKIGGGAALTELSDDDYTSQEKAVDGVKLSYRPGEKIRLTAHVKNIGFRSAGAFRYAWLIDEKEVDSGVYSEPLGEMEEAQFEHVWSWRDGFHHVTFRVESGEPEIATINNQARDPLWGMGLVYIVNPGRVAAWHGFRSAYGTFSFEDFYRWHIEIMNQLFADSVWPSAPQGIRARVRLDRIVYAEDVDAAEQARVSADGLRYDQGAWVWRDQEKELEDGEWIQIDKGWRNRTEWSLPHELGHQLGLIDWYNLDYQGWMGPKRPENPGEVSHVMPDNGEFVTHFMRHPNQMMHWHGPQVWGEADAGYLNMTLGKPRGHYGDYLFAVPRRVSLRIVDVNGRGVPAALVELFQRGATVEPNAVPVAERGVKYWPVVEDGNFGHAAGKQPVIAGATDENGVIRLPNRPVKPVRTINGFERRPNVFGNMNVVGQRGLMLVRVTRNDRAVYFWLDIHEFNTAWLRGHKDRYEVVLRTPYGSVDSPPAPREVKAEKVGAQEVHVRWSPPEVVHEQQYLNRVIGYRVYRRISNDGLNDRPWFPVATVGAKTTSVSVDLRAFPQDYHWYSKAERYAVTAIGDCSVESELVEVLLPGQ